MSNRFLPNQNFSNSNSIMLQLSGASKAEVSLESSEKTVEEETTKKSSVSFATKEIAIEAVEEKFHKEIFLVFSELMRILCKICGFDFEFLWGMSCF